MHFLNVKKKALLVELFLAAVFGAILFGGLLLYVDIPRLSFPYAMAYWMVLFLSLLFLPKAWFAGNAVPVLRDWWEMGRRESRRLLLISGVSTLAFSLAAHGFLFANEFFSHDSLAIMARGPRRLSGLRFFGAKTGRFLIPAYEGLRGKGTNAPWLIGMLFILFMALSAILLVRLLGIRSTAGIALTSGLLCTSTTLALTGATYTYCMDEYAMALLLAIAAVFLIQRRCIVLSIACIVASLAFYQAYFCVALVLSFLCIIKMLTGNQPAAAVIRHGFWHLALLFCGFCLYYLFWTFLCAVSQTEKIRLSETLLAGGASALPALLKGAYFDYFQYLTSRNGILGVLYPAVTCCVVLAIALWALNHLLGKDIPRPSKFLFILTLCLSPLAFNSPYILFMGKASGLISFSNGLVFIFLIFCWEHPPKPVSPFYPRYRVFAIVLLCLACWRNVVFSNQAYMKKDFEKSSTIALVTRIISRIEAVEGYSPNETPVILYSATGYLAGNPYLERNLVPPLFEDISSCTGLWYNYAISSISCFHYYILDYWNYPMALGTFGDLTGAEQEEAETMPLFPADGSVKMINGNVVVRLN